jgi:sugar lactone lactonase YvrE
MRRRRRLAGFLAACAAALGLQAAPAHADELADLVDPQAHFEKIACGFRYVEGPVWDPRGWLLFSDIPANTVYHAQPRIWTSLSRSRFGIANSSKRHVMETPQPGRTLSLRRRVFESVSR